MPCRASARRATPAAPRSSSRCRRRRRRRAGRAAASRAGRRSGPRRGRPARAAWASRARCGRAPCRGGGRWPAGSGRRSGSRASPVSATNPGRTSSRSWARTSASSGRTAGLVERSARRGGRRTSRCAASTGSTSPTTCSDPRGRVGAHGRQGPLEGLLASRTLRPARCRRSLGTIASTAEARQSSSRAGTLPCGLWPSASFWALRQPGEDPLPRRGRVEQQQPAHAEAVLGVGLGPRRQHPQVDGVARVDERGEALDDLPPERSRTSRAAAPKSHCDRPVRSTEAPAPRTSRRAPAAPAASAAASRSLPLAERPGRGRSSTLKVIRRWSGTRVESHSSGVDARPRCARRSTRASSSSEPAPAGRVGVGQGGAGVVGGGDEVAAGGLGQRLRISAVARSSRRPGTCQSKPVVDDLVEHARPGCAR